VTPRHRLAIVTNVDWYFWSHRLPLALAARDAGYDVLVVAGEERGYGKRIESQGLRFRAIPMVRGSTAPLQELRTLRALVAIYRQERPHLVHHVAVKPVLYGSVAAHLARVPAVVNALAGQGYLAASGRGRHGLGGLAARAAYRVAFAGRHTRALFQNPEDRSTFIAHGLVAAERTVLIRGSGVDTQRFHPTPEPAGIPTVVFAGRLLWSKGVGDLLHAVRVLRARGDYVRLILVGTPDTQNPDAVPENILQQWQRSGEAECWGERDDMPEVLSSANLVALPSAYGEGVPKILIEAAAAGRAIVTTDTPGCREIVRNGINGTLVPPRNVTCLAEAVATLLRSPELRARMGIAGREIAVREFDVRVVVDATLELYRQLLDSLPRGSPSEV
jgi:glycosyltransferase involved in cell wall biosynthesis